MQCLPSGNRPGAAGIRASASLGSATILRRHEPGPRVAPTARPDPRHRRDTPDFLTPPVTGGGLSAGIDQLLRTPRVQLVRELSRLAESRPVPNWAASLGSPGSDALKVLANSWDLLPRSPGTALAAHPHGGGNDVGVRARALLDGGTQALLESLRPVVPSERPVLEVDVPVQCYAVSGGPRTSPGALLLLLAQTDRAGGPRSGSRARVPGGEDSARRRGRDGRRVELIRSAAPGPPY